MVFAFDHGNSDKSRNTVVPVSVLFSMERHPVVFPSPAVVKAATSIQPLETTVIFVKQGPRRTFVFVSLRITIYPLIRPFGWSDMGSHCTVTDDEPLLVAEDFGGGSRIWARKKLINATFRWEPTLTERIFSPS